MGTFEGVCNRGAAQTAQFRAMGIISGTSRHSIPFVREFYWGTYALGAISPRKKKQISAIAAVESTRAYTAYDVLWFSFNITGSAVALQCCKVHERINRKTGNSTPCKIVTPENFSSNVCIRDYVGHCNYYAHFFCENRFSGASPQIGDLWLFLTVLSCPFFSILRPGRTVGPIFTLYGSNDVFPRKEVPLGVTTIDDVTWGKYAPNTL